MIKRKIKKPKSKKRKNPYFDDFQNIPLTNEEIRTLHFDLEDAFENGNKSALAEAIEISKIGKVKCTDCKKEYWMCKCEYCPECDSPRCLCDYDIDRNSSKGDIQKLAWEFIKKVYSKENLKGYRHVLVFRLYQKLKREQTDQETVERILKIIKFPSVGDESMVRILNRMYK